MLLAAITADQTRLLVFAALAVVGLVVLVARFKLSAFIALVIASLFVGLGTGMNVPDIAKAFQEGVGRVLGDIAMVVGLGTVLGKLLAESGGAQVIAITDSVVSPLARHAHLVFEVKEAEVQGFRSLASSLCLAQALAVGLAMQLAR